MFLILVLNEFLGMVSAKKIASVNSGLQDWLPMISTIAVPLIVVAVSSYFSSRTNKDNIESEKRNQIANSRIEWIQQVRNTADSYISSSFSLYNTWPVNEEERENGEFEKRLVFARNEVRKNSVQLGLLFSPDSENRKKDNELQINNLFVEFLDSTTEVGVMNKGLNGTEFDGFQNDFILIRDFLRYYLKIEWKRAAEEINDEQSKKLQQENPYIKKIKDERLPFNKGMIQKMHKEIVAEMEKFKEESDRQEALIEQAREESSVC